MASELTRNIIDIYQSRPDIAVLMSLGGSNAEKILSDDDIRDLYNITTVVTDRPTSRAAQIASDNGLTYLPAYTERFTSPEHRLAYFEQLSNELGSLGIEACFYAGFMKVASGSLVSRFPGVNAHPADLTVVDNNGTPLFRGMHAIDLMRNVTDGAIGASVHTVDSAVDTGDTFIRSLPFPTDPSLSEEECHALIKPIEHVIYPTALKMLGRGTLALDNMPYTYNPLTGVLTDVKGEKI